MAQLEDWEKTGTDSLEDWERPELDKKPMAGGLWDHIFSDTPVGRVLSKFGMGAAEGWGVTINTLAPGAEKTLSETPTFKQIFDEIGVGKTKAFNETFGRTSVYNAFLSKLISQPSAAIMAGVQGASEAGQQIGSELYKSVTAGQEHPEKYPMYYAFGPELDMIAQMTGAASAGQYIGPSLGMPRLPNALPKIMKIPETKVPPNFQGVIPETPELRFPKPIEGLPEEGFGQDVFQPQQPELRTSENWNLEPPKGTEPQRPFEPTQTPREPDEAWTPDQGMVSGSQFAKPFELDDHWPGYNVLNEARTRGVIGEGEPGYFDTHPLTDRQLRQRTQAAEEAGLEPELPSAPPDLETLVRQVDPEIMEQRDTLVSKKQKIQEKVQALHEPLRSYPDINDIRNQINLLTAKGKLSKPDQAKLERFRELLQNHTEYQNLQGDLVSLDNQHRDLIPEVKKAYDHAKGLLEDAREQQRQTWYKEAEQYTKDMVEGEQARQSASKAKLGLAEKLPSLGTDEGESLTEAWQRVFGGEKQESLQAEQESPTLKTIEASEEKLEKSESGGLKSVKGTGETKTLGLSKSIEGQAIAKDLGELGDLPNYTALEKEDQINRAMTLMNEDWDRAKAVAMGKRRPPADLHPESILTAVRRRAIMTGDVETLKDLALRSKLPEQAKIMGQRLGMLYDAELGDPVAALRNVQAAKNAAVVKNNKLQQALKTTIDEFRKVVKAKAPKIDKLEAFLDSIQCSLDEGLK